jgi:hypothetical protein
VWRHACACEKLNQQQTSQRSITITNALGSLYLASGWNVREAHSAVPCPTTFNQCHQRCDVLIAHSPTTCLHIFSPHLLLACAVVVFLSSTFSYFQEAKSNAITQVWEVFHSVFFFFFQSVRKHFIRALHQKDLLHSTTPIHQSMEASSTAAKCW